MDRLQAQEEITKLISNVFGDKKRISYEDYVRINTDTSSEMFLSLMTLLQTNMPCSANYFKYKANYEQFMQDDNKGPSETGRPEGTVKTIASPKLMTKLSPVSQYLNTQGINVAPPS